ncbi:MAG: beta-lactamase [Parcubacteria group bacterium Gr01-1014_48]|nr:MAG: beta-lactamase [Parcubacteria group bacterium Greene0416_14]TSC73215.1 MAG: beta-lactamase [Parcubacteria group bacterium Gr01-1014_48]TSD00479.1 MAG: beta-lactamase [Parcubacteria group bacterium Greene1014_15]TSD08386.1 MAG: beta-lactamase [Parcubacteria group bacterium Greene0714_4]
MEEQIRRRIKKAIQEKLFPGCVVGIINRNGSRLIIPIGTHTYEPQSRPMKTDSIFDIASITKVIPLAMVTLGLVERGQLSLDDTVISHLRAFDTSADKKYVTLRHLLTYTVNLDLPPLSSLKNKTPQEIVRRVCSASLVAFPGTAYKYSNVSALLLSLCLMNVHSTYPPGIRAHWYFFRGLQMNNTFWGPDMYYPKDTTVPTEYDPWRGRELLGEVHDESTYTLQQYYPAACLGTAGLFSSAGDLLTFLVMLLCGGTFHGQRYFSQEMVTHMHTKQFPHIDGVGGLGWNLYPQDYMGRYGTPQTFGKTGFTGCMIVADRSKERGLVVLSNYHYPHRKVDLEPNRQFRADICDIVFG